MKRRPLYIYLASTIILDILSMILFVLDKSPIYYNWPYTLFILASLIAISYTCFVTYLFEKAYS